LYFYPKERSLKKFLKISGRILLSLLALLLIIVIAVQTGLVQNWLAGIATRRLSKQLGTEVHIRNVSISLFDKLNMEGLLIRDRQHDTLLYAGALRVRITDWFFLKDSADLHYIGLEDAVVKMQRKGPTWNYQFVADYFSSPPSPSRKKGGIVLNLQKADLKNVAFLKNDEWSGEKMYAHIGSLLLNADHLGFDQNTFNISELKIDEPYFSITSLKALRPPAPPGPSLPDTGLQLNPSHIHLRLGKLSISNGVFVDDADGDKPSAHFDGAHLRFSDINAAFSGVTLNNDTLLANIDLATKERSGLDLKKLKARVRVTPQIMEFASMDLQTNKSRIGPYYAMKYKSFNKDFGDFVTNVVIDARFKESQVFSDDIAFFAPGLKPWKKQITLSGNFSGSISNFNMPNFFARAGNTTYLSGNLSMKGLTDINTTHIHFINGSVKTSYSDIAIFAPIVKTVASPNLMALGNIIFRGNFDGTIRDFAAAGTVSSNLGGVTANVSMQLPGHGDATYTGALTLSRFDVGKFLNSSQLGLVDFNGKISGNSFELEKLKTTLEGNISSLDYNGYTYSDITTNGTFQKKYFNGEVKIHDPNLEFNSSVEVDLTHDQPSFNMVGDLVKMNLRPLNFYKDSVGITGLLDANFTGTNIDNFLGSAKFLNARISKNGTDFSFDSLSISSYYKDSVKYLQLAGNDLNATISGKFSILDLPNSITSFLNRYYPSYVSAPLVVPADQQFNIQLTTNYIEPYLQLFDKKMAGLNDISIAGIVDTRKNIFNLDVKLPYVKMGPYTITGADIKGTGNRDSLILNADILDIESSDSVAFPNTKISIKSGNDHSVVSIKTRASNTLNEADLNADVYTSADGLRLHFNPSSFILNNKKWNLEKEGEIVLHKNSVSAQNVKFYQGFQEITVETDNAEQNSANNLLVRMKNVVLGDITSLFFKDPRLDGIATGEIHLHDFYGKFNAEVTLDAEQFRMDNDSIGFVTIKSGYDAETGKIPFSVKSLNPGYHFAADGFYALKDSSGSPLNIVSKLDNTNIAFVNKFLEGTIDNLKGYATGELTVSGKPNFLILTGDVKLRDASMKIDYTQVTYHIDSTDIKFEPDGINFGQMIVHDSLRNTGIIKGKLSEKGFKDMNFDFDMSTSRLLLIDTKPKDNQQFYGKVIGKANVSFKGPATQCKMTVSAEPTDLSQIYIPNTISKETGDADFIVFKQYGTEMEAEDNGDNFNISVDLDIVANNKAQVNVILDELTGDEIKATGNGRLKISAGTTEKPTIRGHYEIENGKYDFNFQSLIRKPFILTPYAGSYIDWTGDPFDADIHITAQYTADNVSINDLISNVPFDINNAGIKTYRGPVYVVADLSGKLAKPDIKFSLDFPQGSPVKGNAFFAEFVNKIEKDDNEMLKQVTYLVLFNSFAPYGEGGGVNTNFTSLGVNTISQMLSRQLNNTVATLLSKITGDKTVHFDVGTSVYSSANLISGTNLNNSLDRQQVNFKFAKSFFNDKLVVSFGGNFDFNIAAAAPTGNFQWLPDLTVEYYITRDKKLRAIAFNKNSLGLGSTGTTLGRINKQGIGLSYQKDFERIFGKKEKPVTVKAPVTPPTTSNP